MLFLRFQILIFLIVKSLTVKIQLSRQVKVDLSIIQQWNPQQIESISIKICNFGDKQIQYLVSKIKSFPILKNLSLSNNNITYRGIEYLTQLNLPSLKKLILDHNRIGDLGIEKLNKFNLTNLEIFSVSDNSLTQKSMQILSKFPFDNLKSFSINKNRIGKGMQLVSKMIIPNLISLNITETGIVDTSLKQVLNFDTSKLQSLDLSGNLLSIESSNFLSTKNFNSLQNISLGKNEFDINCIKILCKMQLPQLKYLAWRQSKISDSISQILATLEVKKLQILDLSKNELTQKGVVIICKNKQFLKYLFLNENLIYNLQDFNLINQNLQQLAINNNMIDNQFIQNLCHFKSIVYIDLYNNYVSDQGLQAISQCQSNHFHTLKYLNLGNNPIKKKGFQALSKLNLTNLQCLYFFYIPFASDITSFQTNMPKLKQLELSCTLISSKDLMQITKWNIQNIEILSLNRNLLDDDCFQHLAKMNLSKLRGLYLSGNPGIKGLKFSALKNQNISSLKVLQAYHCSINCQGMKSFSELQFSSLIALLIHSNNISNQGLEFLSKLQFPNLQILTLEQNKFDDSGLLKLSNMHSPKLNKIVLGKNCITELSICKFLQNKFLAVVSFESTNITDSIFQCIQPKNYQSLIFLNLQNNNITDQGIYKFKQSVKNIEVGIYLLSLMQTLITNQGLKYLSQIDFPYLTILILFGNEFDKSGIELFLQKKFAHLEVLVLGIHKYENINFSLINTQSYSIY